MKMKRSFIAAILSLALVLSSAMPAFAADDGSKLEEVVVEQAAVLSVDEDSQVEKLIVEVIAPDTEITSDGTIFVGVVPEGSRPIYGVPDYLHPKEAKTPTIQGDPGPISNESGGGTVILNGGNPTIITDSGSVDDQVKRALNGIDWAAVIAAIEAGR